MIPHRRRVGRSGREGGFAGNDETSAKLIILRKSASMKTNTTKAHGGERREPNGVARVINGDKAPTPGNPHTWLPLLGDESGATGDRILWGVLRQTYRDRTNSAAEFIRAKARPSWSADEQAVTATRHDMIAPADADDSFADHRLFAARIDHEIAERADGSTPLLAYATITPDGLTSLHTFYEEVRTMACDLVARFSSPIFITQHAPGLAGNSARPHCHLCLSPYRVGRLGFSGKISILTGDKGRQVIADAWKGRKRYTI